MPKLAISRIAPHAQCRCHVAAVGVMVELAVSYGRPGSSTGHEAQGSKWPQLAANSCIALKLAISHFAPHTQCRCQEAAVGVMVELVVSYSRPGSSIVHEVVNGHGQQQTATSHRNQPFPASHPVSNATAMRPQWGLQ